MSAAMSVRDGEALNQARIAGREQRAAGGGENGEEGGENVLARREEVGEVNPVSAVVVVVEDGFVGDVGVPDEKVLAEGDVPPEDGEAEKQLAHEKEVLVVHRLQ